MEMMAPDSVWSASYADFVPEQRLPELWVHHSMPDSMASKIERAFGIAVERVEQVPECADLFTLLDADGLELLGRTLYFPAGPHRQTTRCRHSFAITSIGGNTTWVCRKVTAHTDEKVAMALIHEALHHAGLTEFPCDRSGMSSGQINDLVMRSCHLW